MNMVFPQQSGASEARAVSIRYFNLYRLVVASVFAIFGSVIHLGQAAPEVFETTVVVYWLLAMLFAVLQMQGDAFAERALGVEVAVDILVLAVFMYASGGNRSGVPFLIMTFVAGAGLVGRGRMVLGAASFATFTILLEQVYRLWTEQQNTVDFTRAGIICVGFFFVAIVARFLAQRALINEALAAARGRDLERQWRVNARIIEDMQDGVVVVNADGVVRHVNPRAEEWLGSTLRSGDYLARASSVLFHASGEMAESCYVEGTGKNLRLRYVEVGHQGLVGERIIYLEDIDRLQAQAQQIKLAALGRLTANIAHEIRNPLSAVGHAGELLEDEKRQDVQLRLLRIIRDNTARIERIVRDVLELGRRDRGMPEKLDLVEFVRGFADEFSTYSSIPKSVVRLVEGDARLPVSVMFDRVHLYQVLTNLVGNAWRYCSKSEGAIRLVFRDLDERRTVLAVVDDGAGIQPDDRPKLFEPFFTSDPKGTGLGLYTARELAEANGASLNLAESHQGAEFHLVVRRVE